MVLNIYILGINSLYIYYLQIFCPIFEFIFLMVVFEAQKFIILIKLSVFIFSFVTCILVSYLRRLCLTQEHRDLLLYFLFHLFALLSQNTIDNSRYL